MLRKFKYETGLGVLMLAGILLLSTKGVAQVTGAAGVGEAQKQTEAAGNKEITIVVDAGHGGDDPGKIGVAGSKEKDINLAIAKKLQVLLEEDQIRVVMTRETAEGLYDSSASNKKRDDLNKRCRKIDEADPVFTVSIHQNSYSQESVHGPQVFYYTHSAQGQEIAQYIQDSMNTLLQIDRPREIKANDTYFLLKQTKSPTLIVECGFLSNQAEEGKLITEEYQQKTAEAIYRGVKGYLEK